MIFIEELSKLVIQARQAVVEIQTLGSLNDWANGYLGRSGEFAKFVRTIVRVPSDQRKAAGEAVNQAKQQLEKMHNDARQALEAATTSTRLYEERVDITEPGLVAPRGHVHLVAQAIQEIEDIFQRMGFSRTRFPEVDWDWYAFEALNMHQDHPARDEWETFFVQEPDSSEFGRMVLTPHATNGTARALAHQTLPIRNINIAKTYRRQIDVTHVPMFHQFDGVYVDQGVSIANLIGVLDEFVKAFFGPERKSRLRPYHFRFTEPSFEIDISCVVCGGTGSFNGAKCRTCKRGWLELGGAGMLHPNVLKAAKIDSRKYSGLAFGWGIERTYMMKEAIKLDDLRTLYQNDVRFLEQF